MRLAALAVLAALLAGCPADPGDGQVATVANRWYRGDLHFHTNYSEDAKRQGGDDLALALQIADAYRDPQYLAVFPERAGSALDFIAVTDHRTDAPMKDPAFGHDHLIVLPGEEYGGNGHANLWGITRHVSHERQADETQAQRHLDAMAEAHAQGALFSINHPTQSNAWPWPVDAIDAVEVWNAPWSAFWGELDEAGLEEQIEEAGFENDYIRGAITSRGKGTNAQALMYWYGMLSRGRHVAMVGGSDRHMITMPGLPTTYVQVPDTDAHRGKSGKEVGPGGILDGIRARTTFVARGPHAAQVVLEAEGPDGTRHPMGSALPKAAKYRIHAKVGRAKDGLLRFVGGPRLPGTGPVTAQPAVLHEVAITELRQEVTFEWTVPAGGGWLHAIVYEPRVVGELTPEMERAKETLSELPEGKDITAMITAMALIVNFDVLNDPLLCDPEAWDETQAMCVPVDRTSLATFYLPDAAERLLNTVFEDGEPTEWCLGAMTSAFLVPGE